MENAVEVFPWSSLIAQPQAKVEQSIQASIQMMESFTFTGPYTTQSESCYDIWRAGDPKTTFSDPSDHAIFSGPHANYRVCVLTVSSHGATTQLTIENPAHHGLAEKFMMIFAAAMQQHNIAIGEMTAQSSTPQILDNEEAQAVKLFNDTYKQEKRQGRVNTIDEWLRRHDIHTSARNFRNWRKKFSS